MKFDEEIKTIESGAKKVEQAARQRISGYIIAGFGLVAGLAWNEAVKALLEKLFPIASDGDIIGKFAYALIITILLALVSVYAFKENNN